MKSLNKIKCDSEHCDYHGYFDIKKQGWYWPVVLVGLLFMPLWLILLFHKNKAVCPECYIESHVEPLVRKAKTGESKVYRFTISVFLIFIAFLFYLAIRSN